MRWLRKDKVEEKKKKEGFKIVEPKIKEEVKEEIKEETVEKEVVEEDFKETSPEEESESTWSVIEVATQTQPLIYNSKTDKQLTLYEAVVELLNRTED